MKKRFSIFNNRRRMMKLVIGNDHAAVDMKNEIKQYLEEKGIEIVDVGTNSTDSFNYPISGYRVGKMVAEGKVDGGIAICGTGVGISLACNKVDGVRACCCSEPYSAEMSKRHNNSNVICFGARVIGIETAKQIVDAWINAKFEGGRHGNRVDMIMEIQDTQHLKAAEEA
jgi:ribose 5-phosphate isomerase B